METLTNNNGAHETQSDTQIDGLSTKSGNHFREVHHEFCNALGC